MTLTDLQQRKSARNAEGGFTLVELAIVMIIIGLLIGGILKGQELIANAQLTATVAQIKGIDGAVSTFRDKYSALPGDMRNVSTRLRDCNGNACDVDGDGNGRIDVPVLGNAPSLTEEGATAFMHLAAADLISGVDLDGELFFGSALPEAKINGGFWLGYTATGAGGGVSGMRPGHYIVMTGLVENVTDTSTAGVTTTQAAQIDRKLDDGDAESGDVQSTGQGCQTSGVYEEATVDANCSIYIRTQG